MSSRRPSMKAPKRNVVMSEVRQQLSMPGAMDGVDDDDASDSRSVARSVASAKSSGQRRNGEAPKSPGGKWKRQVAMKQYADSGASVSSRSAWSVNSKSQRNNQLVADFFDVQSLASDSGTNVGRRKSVSRHQSSEMDSRSLSSKKSVGSSFMGYFFRMRRINDELEDELDDLSQFYGSEMYSVDDEELTLGSGLNSESGQSMYLEDADESSVVVKETIRRIMKSAPPKEEKKPSLLARMLQRRRENKEKKKSMKDTKGRRNAPSSGSVSPYDLRGSNDDDDARSLHSFKRPTKNQNSLKRYPSNSSVGPSRPSSRNINTEHPKESAPRPRETPPLKNDETDNRSSMMNRSPSCRWSGDVSVETSSSAPKPPIRRRDSTGGGEPEEVAPRLRPETSKSPSTRSMQPASSDAPKPPKRHDSNLLDDISVDPNERTGNEAEEKAWRENVRREMAIRKGKDLSESKEPESYHDESDESVLSLLSGLLATWSAERDGSKGACPGQENSGSLYGLNPKRSILKSPSSMDDKPRHSVVFDSIVIREYERTVGDNPSCSRGPPISIGWSYVLAHEYPIDDYELLIKAPKRSKKEFHLSADIRTHLLMEEWDCSEEEIRKARREVTYIQYCRAKSSFSGVRSAAKEALFLKKQAEAGAGGPPQRSGSGGSVGGRPRPGKDAPPARVPRRNMSNDVRPSPSAAMQRQQLVQSN